ncbi:LLM class F420-dependent oxidoreductase [Rhodococcus sp. D2-41]|uniref:LLM class F420-dependent oxidoreductase n=1 Tax=Speluncibacter jeojiensis TaxID=2710754 RepID=A0A9X4M2L0_9ACTN|nr:LLM class F420-dependent oxidoreductase [Rhodococcus sp. D2-41]MDG3011648.1 LLM class F420-dependent oxidoreductase [Rhodococcus sp. D2-41]MDG3014997.1 LLM class F420-dependent oxidoreductase [Corynebacteriales bacterium D3-21]
MKIGLVLPVVVQHPSTRAEWERTAGIAEVAQIAAAADRLGYHHVAASEHVAVPREIAVERGGTYWDPLSTLGFLAARTRRIRLATQVLVLGYHHPLEIAKRYGTLDQVSGGRIVLGLGVGSLREEFDLLGAPFEDRGARADDAIRALRASLSDPAPSYDGPFYSYDGFVVEPHAAQVRVPLWMGGRTRRSLRRATEFGDGWVPFGLNVDELQAMLGTVDLPDGFELVLGSGRRLDPLGDPDATLRAVTRVREAGATVLGVSLVSTGAGHYCDQLHALRELTGQAGCTFDADPGHDRDD